MAVCAFSVVACLGRLDGEVNGTANRAPKNEERPLPPIPPDDGFCENGSLDYGPSDLPAGSVGVEYRVSLGAHAEEGWYGSVYYGSDSVDLAPGLKLKEKNATSKSSLVLSGVPTKPGSFRFTLYAGHDRDSNGCSTMPDPHEFHIEITDGDGGVADGGPSADAATD